MEERHEKRKTSGLCRNKGGRFFSKICSKKFEDRTKRQLLFIDKLELLEGKAPAELTPEEEKTVREHQSMTILVVTQVDEEVVAAAFFHADEVDDLDLIARTSRTFPV